MLIVGLFFSFIFLNGCSNVSKEEGKIDDKKEIYKAVTAGDILPFFDHWNLIAGDGSNLGCSFSYKIQLYC